MTGPNPTAHRCECVAGELTLCAGCVQRGRAERVAQGLPERITDPSALDFVARIARNALDRAAAA